METRVRVPDSLQDDKSQFFLYTTENWLFSFPSDNQIFTPHPVSAKPCKLWDGAGNVADFSVKNVGAADISGWRGRVMNIV